MPFKDVFHSIVQSVDKDVKQHWLRYRPPRSIILNVHQVSTHQSQFLSLSLMVQIALPPNP